jgi:hypothetical protein
MQKKQIEKIITVLEERALETNDQKAFDRLEKASRAFREWDGSGEIPHKDLLTDLNIDFQDDSPQQKTEKQAEEKTQKAKAEPALKPEISDALREALLEADHLERADRLYHAIKFLEDVLKSMPADAAQQIKLKQADLRVKLGRLVNQLVERAQSLERKQPNDLKGHLRAWQVVHDADPEHNAANEALRLLNQQILAQTLENDLKEALEKATKAEKDSDLLAINDAKAIVQGMVSRASEAGYPQELHDKVVAGLGKIDSLLVVTRDRLGVASTKQIEGDVRGAYQMAREYIESDPQPTMIVDANRGIDVPLKDFWKQIRKEFVSDLRNKASERMVSAAKAGETSPKAAMRLLLDAQAMVTDDVLTQDDLAIIEIELQNINLEIKAVQEEVDQYNDAKKLVLEGQDLRLKPEDRLEKLNQAKELFSEYSGLDNYLEIAKSDFEAQLARQGHDALVSARNRTSRDEFEQALTEIDQILRNITTVIQSPKEDSPLGEILKELDNEKAVIQKAQNQFEKMLRELERVSELLKEYDAKKEVRELMAARKLLEAVAKENPDHERVLQTTIELTRRQGDPDNWEAGNSSYKEGEWKSAVAAFRQVSPSYPAYEEAQTFLKRAQAALEVDKARQHEANKEWEKAANAYQITVGIFEGTINQPAAGIDSFTASLAKEASESLDRLKVIYQNDKEIDGVLSKCIGLLNSAKHSAQNRNLPVDKVERIPVFAEISKELEKAKENIISNRSFEIDDLLRETREIWLETYISGMEFVADQKQTDRSLLAKSAVLSDELREEGLLFGYEQVDCQLQSELLDIDYRVMGGGERFTSTSDLVKLEENRRARFEVQRRWPYDADDPQAAQLHHAKVKELQQEFSVIASRRLRLEMERELTKALERAGGDLEASVAAHKEILDELVKDDRVYGSIASLTYAIQIAWKAREWQKADAFIRSMREITEDVALASLWGVLDNAAQAFEENRIEEAHAYLDGLPVERSLETNQIVSDMETATLLRLLALGKDAYSLESDQGYLSAAQKYALAYKIDPRNPSVLSGLEAVGSRIDKTITRLCTEASSLQLRGSAMSDLNLVTREAKEKLETLNSFTAVSGHLKLSAPIRDRLSDTTERLVAKSRVWHEVKDALDKFEAELEGGLISPTQINPRDNSGGWGFDDLEQYILKSRQSGRSDVQLMRLIEAKNIDWIQKRDVARELNEKVVEFLDFIEAEEFDRIINEAGNLEELWKKAQREQGFEGLGILIFELYSDQDKAKTPAEHREIAQKQKKNYGEWTRWSLRVRESYEALSKIQKDLQFHSGGWKTSGDELRKSLLEQRVSFDKGIGMALSEIVSLVNRGNDAVAIFLEAYHAKPQSLPLTKKAELELKKIPHEVGNQEVLDEFKDYATALKLFAEQRILEINKALLMLRTVVNGVAKLSKNGQVPRASLENAMRQVRSWRAKDPYNRELEKLSQKLNNYTPR